MTKIKKLISGILVFAIIGISISVAAGEVKEDNTFDYAREAWEILSKVGVLSEDVQYISGKEVIRSEIVKYIIQLSFYLPVTDESVASGFSDVDDSEADSAYIKAASRAGFISGHHDGTFRPEESVTYSQATKMLVSLLGYERIAELSGGYPHGYSSIAEKLDIFKHIDKSSLGEYVTSDNMMIMLLNTAEADLADTVGYINDKVSPFGRKGVNLLSEKFSIYSIEAVVNANEYTSLLSDDGETDKGFIKGDDTVYKINNTDVTDCLGMRMKMYYYQRNEGDIPEVKYLKPSEKKNKVIEINAKDVEGVEDSSKLVYYVNDNKKSLRLSQIFYFVKNGRMSVFNEEKLKSEVGTVKLIDNDGDNKYDVISMMGYTSYVVSDISLATETISTKQNISIQLNTEDATTIIKKDGAAATISDIKKGTVISYAETESGTMPVRTLILSEASITGTIEKCSEDSITVDGVTYNALPAALEHIKLGKQGTVYIDVFGNAVYSDCENDIVYGYLNALALTGLGEDVCCRIFTENGRWVDLYMADRVKYNGKTARKAEVYAALGSNPLEYRQLIRYNVNDDAKINSLETANKLITMGTELDAQLRENDTFRLSFKNESQRDDSRYVTTAKSFMGKISVSADTVIFSVPDQSEGVQPDKFRILGMSDLYGDYKYTFLAYDANEVRTAGALVITNQVDVTNDPDNVSQVLFVTGTGKTVNTEGVPVDAIMGFFGSEEELSFPVQLAEPPANLYHDASLIKDVNELVYGDIVQLKFSSAGDVEQIDRWIKSGSEYSFLGDWGTSTNDTELYIRAGFIAGRVMAAGVSENRIVMQYTEDGKTIQLLTNNNTKVFIHEASGKQGSYKRGSLSDVLKNDKIYVSERYLVCKEIIIMR